MIYVFRCLIFFLVLALSACHQSTALSPLHPFPAAFHWGVTTAAYQNEGGIRNDWTAAGVDAGMAVEHRRRFGEDVEQMHRMGINTYRFSIEWALVEPKAGQWKTQELARYAQQIHQLKQAGIEPMVTLWHFTQPEWVARQGGWQNPQTVLAYLRYVETVVKALGPDVRWWLTLNEPMVYAIMTHYKGKWPPFHHARAEMDQVLVNLLSAHAQAYALIHRLDPDAKVSLAQSQAHFVPWRKWHPGDWLASWGYGQAYNYSLWNTIFQTGSSFPFNWSEIPGLPNSLDWLAINYYARYYITLQGQPLANQGEPANYLKREADPEGFYQLMLTAGKYAKPRQLPVFITENGWADDQDRQRPCYLLTHLAQVQRALQAGVPIQGYLHWTLTDNFEWTEGFNVSFGLLDTQRHWKHSAYVYQDVIRQRQVSQTQLAECPPSMRYSN